MGANLEVGQNYGMPRPLCLTCTYSTDRKTKMVMAT